MYFNGWSGGSAGSAGSAGAEFCVWPTLSYICFAEVEINPNVVSNTFWPNR